MIRVEVDVENKTVKTIVLVDGEEYHLCITDDGLIVDLVKGGEVESSCCYDFEDLLPDPDDGVGDLNDE
jgi:hypothetical protein